MLFILLLLGMTLNDGNPPPQYPPKFTQSILETFKYGFIKKQTKAKIFYDWQTKKYRYDRENGLWDRYCGTVYKLVSTPCSHYVSEGKRYLHYPEKNYCCMCCDESHGCGILKTNWMENATFIEEFEKDGKKYEKWDKQGLQHNFVVIEKDSRRIVSIDQQPNDLMEFDASSYQEDFDNSLLQLPENCKPDVECTVLSVCGALREGAFEI